jgi:hypothetical protein
VGQYTWYSGDLRTGRIYGQTPVVSQSWANVMDDAGPMQLVAQLTDPDIQALNLPSTAAPAKSFLAVAYSDDFGTETFLEGGPVWVHSYDDVTGQLTIGGAGLWSYFDHRKVIAVLGASNPAALTATYAGLSLGTIAKRLVELAATHTGGNLPIVLPADEAEASDDAHTRTYNGYDMAWVGAALRDLTGVIGGPEIAFRPRRQAADPRFIEWVMLTGTEEDPLLHQTGPDWIFDQTAAQSPITSLGCAIDGTKMGDESWVKGSGQEAGTIFGHYLGTTLTDRSYPLLELEVTGHDSSENTVELDGYAQADVTNSQHPILTLTPKIDRDSSPTVALYAVGDYVQMTIAPGHPYFTAGASFRTRITGKAGDDSTQVTLQLAPIPGEF